MEALLILQKVDVSRASSEISRQGTCSPFTGYFCLSHLPSLHHTPLICSPNRSFFKCSSQSQDGGMWAQVSGQLLCEGDSSSKPPLKVLFENCLKVEFKPHIDSLEKIMSHRTAFCGKMRLPLFPPPPSN